MVSGENLDIELLRPLVESMVQAPGNVACGSRSKLRVITSYSIHYTKLYEWLALGAFALYAASALDFTWERFVVGIDNGARFIGRMFPPDLSKWDLLAKGLYESLEIAVIASVLGIVLSLPIGLLAARNLMPPWVTWPARGFIALCRSFHQVIIAILFVKAVGFGALAGILALIA